MKKLPICIFYAVWSPWHPQSSSKELVQRACPKSSSNELVCLALEELVRFLRARSEETTANKREGKWDIEKIGRNWQLPSWRIGPIASWTVVRCTVLLAAGRSGRGDTVTLFVPGHITTDSQGFGRIQVMDNDKSVAAAKEWWNQQKWHIFFC